MVALIREKKIKSADRVLEILEMFDAQRDSVTVMDVARCLHYPQSSTSELLGSLVRHGYLVRDRYARTYRPTSRVALLGAWVQPTLFRHGRLLPMIDELRDECGAGVALGSIVGVGLKHLHVVGEVPDALRTGSEHHALHSPLGKTILSIAQREYVRKLVHRLNAENDPDVRVRFDDLAVELDRARSQGFAAGAIGEDYSMVAVLLPAAAGDEKLALGLIVPSADLGARQDDLVHALRSAVSSHLKPATSRPTPVPAHAYAMAS